MARKTLLSEGEIRQFMKLANLVPLGHGRLEEMGYGSDEEEALDEEEHRQMVWVNYLNIFATLAPMIGLLGTVWGMIEAFDKLATTSGDAKQLAGGIKIAMVTTAGGLMVGIPAMFFYFFFRDKLQGVMTTVQKRASFAIDILSGEIRLQGATDPAAQGVAEEN